MENRVKRVILDLGSDMDDSLALLYALKCSQIKVEGVTTKFGLIPVGQSTMNMLQVSELTIAGNLVPIARGAEAPLRSEWDGIMYGSYPDNDVLRTPKREAQKEHAADLIIRKIREYPGQITIVSTGPLTNIALALEKAPNISGDVQKLIIVGDMRANDTVNGAIPELNEAFQRDMEAAYRILKSGVPVTMVGQDIVRQVLFTPDHLQQLSQRGRVLACPLKFPQGAALQKRVIKYVEHILKNRFNEQLQAHGIESTHLPAPLAVAIALNPKLVQAEETYFQSEREHEQTVYDLHHSGCISKTNVSICTSVDENQFLTHFIDVISASDPGLEKDE